MEWRNLGIPTLKHAIYALKVFKRLPGTINFIYLTSTNFVTISHINYWDQVNSGKNLQKFWNYLLCRNKSAPLPLLNVAAYLKNSNTDACTKKLSWYLGDVDSFQNLYEILWNNLNMQYSMVMFNFSVIHWQYDLWANLFKKKSKLQI